MGGRAVERARGTHHVVRLRKAVDGVLCVVRECPLRILC